MLHLQVYTKTQEDSIRKIFHKVSDPSSLDYGKYRTLSPVSPEDKESVESFLQTIKGASYRKTTLEGVYCLTLPHEQKITWPKNVAFVTSDPHFLKFEALLSLVRQQKDIVLLPKVPQISSPLKKRLNVEWMIEGIKGRTLLASQDSAWAEFPSLTIFGPPSETTFSPLFNRKIYAPYQHKFVHIYFWDPEHTETLKKIDFPREGRGSPDLLLKSEKAFLKYLHKMNHERRMKGAPSLGFLNFLLYQNPHAFEKSYRSLGPFPTSFSLWSANRGLGKPIYKKLTYAISQLDTGNPTLVKRFLKALSHLF